MGTIYLGQEASEILSVVKELLNAAEGGGESPLTSGIRMVKYN
jgi:hypothetical protein